MLYRLSLEKRFILIVVSSVILGIVVLTALIIRRETSLFRAEYRRNAHILATTISRALKDSMLAGRAEETKRLIRELSGVEGISGLSVMKQDFERAFGMSGPILAVNAGLMERVTNGEEVTVSQNGAQYFLKPLRNEGLCWSCHPKGDKIRGIILVKMPAAEIEHNTSDLMKRMVWFGLLIGGSLSGFLVVQSRRMLLSRIKGLIEASRQITEGNFILFEPRGTQCYEIRECGNTSCPSYGDDTVPCWLKSGTLCSGKPEGDVTLKQLRDCQHCRVYKELKGDELVQLTDVFNRMSSVLKKQEQDTRRYIEEIESLNSELTRSNDRLGMLLNASRMTTSTLELDQTIATSLGIILGVAHMKTGVICFIEEDKTRRCYEFFDCSAYNCAAYKVDVSCWRLPGTVCNRDASVAHDCVLPPKYRNDESAHTHYNAAMTIEEKTASCSKCEFFSNVVLIPKMEAGFKNGRVGERLKIESLVFHRALMEGKTSVGHSGENPFLIPMDTRTEIVVPLKLQDQVAGILYLASDETRTYGADEVGFIQLLSEIISSGIFNSRLFEEIDTSYFQTVMSLSNAVEAKDPYTRGHSERVSDLSLRIADAMNMSREEKEHLRFASILHDIGKIGISRDLLRKEGRLDECEKTEIKSHPERGVSILDPVSFLRPALPAIRHHHERFDGSGYPLGLKGKKIPFKARIICVADAWDAMRSTRPYRDALPYDAAVEELTRHAGSQFDPEIVEVFTNIISGSR